MRSRAANLLPHQPNAAALYVSLGFRPTGGVDEEFGEPNYKLTGAALAKFRK